MTAITKQTDEQTRDRQIAMEILRQLGGRRFIAMTGAKQFCAIEYGIRFRLLGKNFAKDDINLVKILLTSSDLYEVTFSKMRGGKHTRVKRVDGADCENLAAVFTQHTGLDTKF